MEKKGKIRVAMVGNPNVGKTALLNAITGGRFEIGNFPGTTVEKKEGTAVINNTAVYFIDLPGIYSLHAYTIDEKIARDYLVNEKPDIILNVINAANLERNLYLTLQLCELGIPMVIALNMMDEAKKMGLEINSRKLEEILGVPVVETVAIEKIGIDSLKEKLFHAKVSRIKVKDVDIRSRIKTASEIASKVVTKKEIVKTWDDILDEVFTDKYFGIPIFLAFMWIVFRFTYDVAAPLVTLIDIGFSELSSAVLNSGLPFSDLIANGIITGIGSVLVFIPNISFLFIALAILELSGYMTRAVFILNKIMLKFGLTGRSVIPLIIGFGCNVPAVMATRGIEDDKVRLTTIIINPFMSCSARLPIYVLFAGAFFAGYASLVIMFLYLFGVCVALTSALLIRKTVLPGEASFILEIPPYRIPKIKSILDLTWIRVKHFLVKAGSIILAMSVVVWYITTYPGGSIETSYAAMLGKIVQPLFSPLGWKWELVFALITGFIAKEVVVETLGIILGDLSKLSTLATVPQALGFLVFSLLYIPCLATLAVIRSETGSWKWTAFAVVYGFSVAYVLSFILINILGLLI